MKTISAFWEKLNLGVEAMEFVIENNDTEVVAHEILKSEAQYNVVKLPAGKPKLTLFLQDNGYRFIECMLNFTHDLSEEKIEAAKSLNSPCITHMPMTESDFCGLFIELENGLFNTDRIYNDPHFAAGTSAIRYMNWIDDERKKGSVVYKLILQEVIIGFFALKKMENNLFDPFLLGLYHDYKGRGLGRSLAFNAMSECVAQRASGISTHISSNNPANIKVYKSLGYDVKHLEYVLIKHNE